MPCDFGLFHFRPHLYLMKKRNFAALLFIVELADLWKGRFSVISGKEYIKWVSILYFGLSARAATMYIPHLGLSCILCIVVTYSYGVVPAHSAPLDKLASAFHEQSSNPSNDTLPAHLSLPPEIFNRTKLRFGTDELGGITLTDYVGMDNEMFCRVVCGFCRRISLRYGVLCTSECEDGGPYIQACFILSSEWAMQRAAMQRQERQAVLEKPEPWINGWSLGRLFSLSCKQMIEIIPD